MYYFDDENNVDDYLALTQNDDGRDLIAEMVQYLPQGAKVLELGMGGGKDLDLLIEAGFNATGSDVGGIFLRRYKERGGQAPILQLDIRTILTDEHFDAIYSNKVLIYPTYAEMHDSLQKQAEILNDGGLLFHSLWYGEEKGKYRGYNKYTPESLMSVIPNQLEVIETKFYSDIDPNDSLWVVIGKK